MKPLTKVQYNSLVAKNKRAERKEIIEAVVGAIAIFAFGYLFFSIAL
jgi:hypothetical protein